MCALFCDSVRKPLVQSKTKLKPFEGVAATNIHAFKLNGKRETAAEVTVKMCSTWLGSGSTTVANFAVRPNPVVPAAPRPPSVHCTGRDLEAQWKRMAVEAVEAQQPQGKRQLKNKQNKQQAEILDAEERVKLKRGASDTDKVVMVMGPKVLKRKRDAVVASPSFVLYVDDPRIIDLELFENLDQVLLLFLCWV